MRGDCSIRIEGIGFSAEEIAACASRQGLLQIEIELSSAEKCACTHCQAHAPAPVLSNDEVNSLVDQARVLGCRRVILIDDDARSCPALEQLIDDLRAKELSVELFTSVELISAEAARFFFERRISLQLTLSEAAHDVPSAVDHDANGRTNENIQLRDIAAIGHLVNAGYGKSNGDGPSLAARIHVNAENVGSRPALWRELRTLGINPHIQIMTPASTRESGGTPLDPQRARRLFEHLGEIDRVEFGRVWELPPSLTGRSCKRHLFACHVTACGSINACVGVTIPLGNIRTEPLRDILGFSDVLEDLRAYQHKVKEPCRSCSQSNDCYGCRGSAFQLTGDYLAGDQQCWKADGELIPSLPIEVNDLIPHGPTMRMVDQLVQIGERTATTNYTIAADSLWVDSVGKLDESAYIELIAQSFASSHGFHLTAEQRKAHQGLLLGIKDLVISGHAHVGDRLVINLRKMARFGDFGIVRGEVRHEDGRLIAAGELKVWRPSEEPAKVMIP